MSTRACVVLLLALLVVANLLTNRVWPGHNVALALVFVAALLGVARLGRLSPADLGLARTTWGAGLRWGLVCVALVAAAYAIVLLVPAFRESLSQPDDTSPGRLALTTLVLLPLSTVIPEELAFRGVLWALVRRDHGTRAATLFSSLCFGIWHVLPALGGGAANDAANDVVGTGALGTTLRVVGTVLFTGAAGVLFCELRRRSGSLLAPILLHWGVNGLGDVAVRLA